LEARTLGDLDDDERDEVLRVLGRFEQNLAGTSEPRPPVA
jgi:hypothetical protein